METLILASHMLLFACASMYLGTGWSLVLFSFPTAEDLTPDNYYTHIVPQVQAATRFFTWMTNLMLVLVVVMIVTEWGEPLAWVPWVVLAGIVASTALTILGIFEHNERLADGIEDPEELATTLRAWMRLNIVRVSLWTVQWLALAVWFVAMARRGT